MQPSQREVVKVRKITVSLLLLGFMLLTGCGLVPLSAHKTSSQGPASDDFHIVTSFYPLYIMLLNISADIDGVTVTNLTRNETGCLHDYQLTPGDLQKLQEADVLVINGAGMESFMDKIMAQFPDIAVVDATRGLELIEHHEEFDHHDEVKHHEEDNHHEEANPHLWVSVAGAAQQVDNISRQLAVLDPEHGEAYLGNSQVYIDKLRQLGAEMHEALDTAPRRHIVTFHEAFDYFANEFNLDVVAVVEREPGSEPSAGELAQIIEDIKQQQAVAVFTEPQYPPQAAETIARESGVAVYALDPGVSGPEDADAYLRLMRQNMEVLKRALYR